MHNVVDQIAHREGGRRSFQLAPRKDLATHHRPNDIHQLQPVSEDRWHLLNGSEAEGGRIAEEEKKGSGEAELRKRDRDD